jgi:hypothetical protein
MQKWREREYFLNRRLGMRNSNVSGVRIVVLHNKISCKERDVPAPKQITTNLIHFHFHYH